MDNVRELMAKRAALLSQADAILKTALDEGRSTTSDENLRVDELMLQAKGMQDTIERAERSAQLQADLPHVAPAQRPDLAHNSGAAQRQRDEAHAIAQYIRRGDPAGLMDLY